MKLDDVREVLDRVSTKNPVNPEVFLVDDEGRPHALRSIYEDNGKIFLE